MSIAFRIVIQDQVMGYHPVLATICGGLAEGVLLGRLLYWDGVMANKYKDKYRGEYYKKDEELREETGLSYSELKTAKKNLQAMALIELNVRGVPPTTHYTVRVDTLQAAIEKGEPLRGDKHVRGESGKFAKSPYMANQIATNGELIGQESVNQITENRSYIHYTTQDTTQNTTQEESEAKPASPPETPKPVKPSRERKAKPKAPHSPTKDSTSENVYDLSRALIDVCHLDAETYGSRIFKEAKRLRAAALPATADLVQEKYGPGGWWYLEDWRGKKGEFPTPDAICKTWAQWTKPKVIPINRNQPTKVDLIREMLNGDGTDDQSGIGAIFGSVPNQGGRAGATGAPAIGMAASARRCS